MCIVTPAITVPNVYRGIMEYIVQVNVIRTVSIVRPRFIVKSASPDFMEAGVILIVIRNV